ncbi:preprotein translocase subunit SecE [Candidatus Gottesmanbacteria bacterium RIFCSPHIGHO2_01_FULL_39_10]|uniref:Protein translocase subunit SecE n=1 Tax=Candidatus Gottesmanbacteria bacterium RIFCSPHIGHO2_01_FULL_39_10 TaxID=1798375 RepID=A0A1F5ZPI6_9BACT|nr:MAG: preprotein translocase subunit SecE [Candidatus Gottesmanbacteria bacterium RIFCSPHIGHO2_01_FULL_39_10]
MAVSPVVFLKEAKMELAKVTWPTKEQTIKLTVIVIAISVILGSYIGALDLIFTKLTDVLIKR